MKRAFVCCAAVAASLAAAPDPGPRLTYAIQRLGHAESATVASPGAAGTAFCFALTSSLGDWSRFNWPTFEPVAGLLEVRFWARADGPVPGGLFSRLLSADGNEWQSAPVALTAEWQEIALGAADYTWFRGASKAEAGTLDLGRTQQFQIVPVTRTGQGQATLWVDEIRILPGGPVWTAETTEQRPHRDPAELDRERLCDLVGRWQAELDRLDAETDRTRRWATDIEALIADWQAPDRRPAALDRLRRRTVAWHEPMPRCPLAPGVPVLSLDDYRRQLASVDTPPVPLLDLSQPLGVSVDRLYGAPPQEAPAVAGADGQAVLRHHIRFTADAARQAVFTVVALPKAPVDLDGRRVLMRLRCTATGLHPEMPMLLRLYTDAGGSESWADLVPSPAPGPGWTDIVFDVANPLRQTRANPAATRSLALRFDNAPGTPADFDVEVMDVRAAAPDPAALVRRTALAATEDRLAQARDRLAARRDRVAALEDELRALPELRALYLASFEDRRLARDQREAGPGSRAVVPAGPTPLLRHVSHPRQPDWTFLLDGQCRFPRLTVYHWPEPDKTELAGVRLLGDLWVDGLRFYGLSINPAIWDRFDRCGLTMLSSLAPGYRTLENWDDMASWEADYARTCRMALSLRNRPAQIVAQVGNEVELSAWGADLGSAFPDALYQPLDHAAAILRREWDPVAPIMYVRAGSFREVPPLPHEQLCGVNQYTGRYGGRLDEIGRDLAELARYSLWADRPLMITEWMGPQYSWATGGIGGVSPRGAAYYLERYWRAMTATPGIVGSSEFTLNWVIAPFEDLTNQTREEAWKNRPRHDSFGGGHTADHVPIVAPEQAVRTSPVFRSMQAFQSPLYGMVNGSGHTTLCGPGADLLAAALAPMGADVRLGPTEALLDPAAADGHLVLLRPVGDAAAFPAGATEPVCRTGLNPAHPDLLLTTLDAPSQEARQRGLDRLIAAATALTELRQAEGAMSRALVLSDAAHTAAYASYLLEFAGRGYLFSGDDVRTELDPGEVLDPEGRRRPAWAALSAVILDCTRPLQAAELALVNRLAREGANLLIAADCYTANPALHDLLPATLSRCGTLADPVPVVAAAQTPLPVRDLGSAEIDRIRRFRPDLAGAPGLDLFSIATESDAEPLASSAGKPVIVRKALGEGQLFLLGVRLGAAVEIHRRTTHAGSTHPLYDRDTACGLERLSRVVVNLCRYGCPETRLLPALAIHLVPETTQIAPGEPLRCTMTLTDAQGRTVRGQARARVRVMSGGRPAATGPYVDVPVEGPVPVAVPCIPASPGTPPAGPAPATLSYSPPTPARRPLVVSLQVKAYADGFVPADGAVAFAVSEPAPEAR